MVKASHRRDSAGRFTAADGPIKKGIFLRVTAKEWNLLEAERKRRGLPAITTLVMDQVAPLLRELREERGELRE